jgi:predicted naringenin-chalcone synthase
MHPVLTDFQVIRPKHEGTQESLLEWMSHAHARAENDPSLQPSLKHQLFKIGIGPEKIQTRSFQLQDLFHSNWEEMEIYALKEGERGKGAKERTLLFERETDAIFEQFYPDGSAHPSHIVHVTCTGYVAPSPAQKLVSMRHWGKHTVVTHAYHMGCYASIPALRIAAGYKRGSTDIVHTELCSLHMNPLLHNAEQLVIQTLFADGFIKYSLADAPTADSPALQILAIHEEILPDSRESMTWKCEDWGTKMTIAREVPQLIAQGIIPFMESLANQAGFSFETLKKSALFAIHPGGPKIIEQISQILELSPLQTQHSREILRTHGNMSSATLPHIWNHMLHSEVCPKDSLIVSVAFGPGLSISGAIFQKKA